MKKANNNGFTLIELMITILLVAIILGLGVPSFQEMMQRNRATGVANELLTSMVYARSEATKQPSIPVRVCASADGASCGAATDWNSGWLAFADADGDGSLDTGERVLQVWVGPGSNYTLAATAGAATVASVQFNGDGSASAATSFLLTGPGATPQKRKVDITATGRASVLHE